MIRKQTLYDLNPFKCIETCVMVWNMVYLGSCFMHTLFLLSGVLYKGQLVKLIIETFGFTISLQSFYLLILNFKIEIHIEILCILKAQAKRAHIWELYRLQFKSWFCHSLFVHPYISRFTYLGFHFLIVKWA